MGTEAASGHVLSFCPLGTLLQTTSSPFFMPYHGIHFFVGFLILVTKNVARTKHFFNELIDLF